MIYQDAGGIFIFTMSMESFILRCSTPSCVSAPDSFFILSRGPNAGRPSLCPGANSFRLSCQPEDRSRYFNLVYTIWETGGFRPYLKGSLILFLRIGDARKCIIQMHFLIDQIERVQPTLDRLRELERQLEKQLKKIRQIRPCLLQEVSPPSSPRCGAPRAGRAFG